MSPRASSSWSCWPGRRPPVEFEGPLVAARAAGAARAERLAELEQAKLSRCGSAALLERRAGAARRSCPALYDTASDLAGLRDLDAVLRAIVHRARTCSAPTWPT